MSDPNSSMTPAILYVEPDAPRFQDDYRRWQGIPSIEVTEKGRIFVNFFSGQGAEVGGNFLIRTPSAVFTTPVCGYRPPENCG